MMTDFLPPPVDWESCPPGLLSKYPQRMHRRRMLTLAATTVASAGCVAAAGFLGFQAYLQRLDKEYQFNGLTCADVRELMPEYRERTLDPVRSDHLEEHVRRCPQCARFRTELREPAVT